MTLLRHWTILIVGAALLLGMALGTWTDTVGLDRVTLIAVGLALLGGAGVLLRLPLLVVGATLGLVITAGYGYALVRLTLTPPLGAEHPVTEARAVIVSAPQSTGSAQRAYVDLTLPVGVRRVRMTWQRPDQLHYGDIIAVSGTIQPPRVEPDFDERGFLLAHGAVGTLKVDEVEPTDEQGGQPVLRSLHRLRTWLLTRLDTLFPFPEEAVVAGMLLGEQSALPEALEEAFRRTGTTHVLVASGTNVLVLAVVARWVFGRISRRWSLLAASLLVIDFVVISGGEASIVRAATFFLFIVLAELTGRRVHAPTLITFVAVLIALTSPWVLLYDLSFQLSFAAVLGLLTFEAWFATLLPPWLIPDYLAPTLAAELTTLPVLLYHFGQASVVGPLANLLVVPAVPAVMAGAAFALALPAARIFEWATEGLVDILITIVNILSRAPFIELEATRVIWAVVALGLVIAVWLTKRRWERRHRLEFTHDTP